MAKKRRHQTAYQKAYRKIEQEGRKQCYLKYGAAGLCLLRSYGKKQRAILRFFELTGDVWRDCAKDNMHSMIEMCEQETGIEIQCGNGKSWHDLPYLNASIDTGRYTNAQLVYIRQKQVEWIPAQVMACILLSLRRKYKFGFDRCARFYSQVQEIEAEFGGDPEKIRDACLSETGVNVVEIVTERKKRSDGEENLS